MLTRRLCSYDARSTGMPRGLAKTTPVTVHCFMQSAVVDFGSGACVPCRDVENGNFRITSELEASDSSLRVSTLAVTLELLFPFSALPLTDNFSTQNRRCEHNGLKTSGKELTGGPTANSTMEVPTEQPQTPTMACAAVFNIYELAEGVMLELSMIDIFNALLVCKSWNHVIQTSPSIRRLLTTKLNVWRSTYPTRFGQPSEARFFIHDPGHSKPSKRLWVPVAITEPITMVQYTVDRSSGTEVRWHVWLMLPNVQKAPVVRRSSCNSREFHKMRDKFDKEQLLTC